MSLIARMCAPSEPVAPKLAAGLARIDLPWMEIKDRRLLFAPVYFDAGVYTRVGFHYSPSFAINLGVFSDHLFVRPVYEHYYFGDYYAASYVRGGYYASYSFQSSRYGYDPFYAHQRWEHRQDREWEHRVVVALARGGEYVISAVDAITRTTLDSRGIRVEVLGDDFTF
jgi:hypothetical protein